MIQWVGFRLLKEPCHCSEVSEGLSGDTKATLAGCCTDGVNIVVLFEHGDGTNKKVNKNQVFWQPQTLYF